MAKRKASVWDDVDHVKSLLSQSNTTTELLRSLSLPLNTTNYRNARNFGQEHNIDMPKISSESRSELSRAQALIRNPTQDIFVENSPFDRSTVKRRAIKEGFLEYKCYGKVCQVTENATEAWEGLVLQLEHKNGIGDDNRVENLELLCPNCHSLTETYGSGNGNRYENGAHGNCESCGKMSRTKICLRCVPVKRELSSVSIESVVNDISYRGVESVAKDYDMVPHVLLSMLRRRISKMKEVVGDPGPDYKGVKYPPIEEIVNRVEKHGFLKVAKEIGVSDNGLRKHIKSVTGKVPKSPHRKNSK